jgi:hypothetical protein
VRKIAGILFGIFLAAGMAQAQIPTSGNIFFGYSYSGGNVFLHDGMEVQSTSHTASLNGWQASLEGKFLPWIGIVLDGAVDYGSHSLAACGFVLPPCHFVNIDGKRYTLMLGPQVSVPVGKVTPFAHALFGGAHMSNNGSLSSSDTSFATAIGGGLDYKLIKGLALRFQGDELHTSLYSGAQNHLRLAFGIDVRF